MTWNEFKKKVDTDIEKQGGDGDIEVCYLCTGCYKVSMEVSVVYNTISDMKVLVVEDNGNAVKKSIY